MSHRPAITVSMARAMASKGFEVARQRGAAVTITITDGAGFLVLLERSDDASLASIAMSQAKARTAALYRVSTKAILERVVAGQIVPPLPDLVAAAGGVPLLIDCHVIGAVGVSGASADIDEAVARAAVAEAQSMHVGADAPDRSDRA